MKKSILIAFALLWNLTSFGQGFFQFNDNGWDFHVGLGISNTNMGDRYDAFRLDSVIGNDLNDLQNANQPVVYPKPSNSLYQFSIGGYGVNSGIIYGGEVSYGMVLPSERSFTNLDTATMQSQRSYMLRTSYYTTSVMLQVGVIAYRNSFLVIYPFVGAGYGAAAVRIANTQEGNKVYPVMSSSNNRDNKVLWNDNFSYEFGLGADLLFGKGGGSAKGFKLGIRAGFFQMVPQYNLKSNGVKIREDIKEDNTGLYDGTRPQYYQHLTGSTAPVTNESQMYKKLGLTAPYIKLIIGIGRVGSK